MSYFKIGKAEALKIFTSWDFLTYKSFEIKENTTCKELNDKLTSFHQSFQQSDSTKHISLFMILREIKQKKLIFKRKINYFESPLQIYHQSLKDFAEEPVHKEILFISISLKEFYPSPESEGSHIFANFNSFIIGKGGKSIEN